MPSHQLDGPALRRLDPQPELSIEIPPGRRQPILLGLIRGPERCKKRPVLLREQLEPAREGKAPVGIREMDIDPEGGVVEVLSLGEAEGADLPPIVIEREDERRHNAVRPANPVISTAQ